MSTKSVSIENWLAGQPYFLQEEKNATIANKLAVLLIFLIVLNIYIVFNRISKMLLRPKIVIITQLCLTVSLYLSNI